MIRKQAEEIVAEIMTEGFFSESKMRLEKDTPIYSRDGQKVGKATGKEHKCPLEGCSGWRQAVRWPDNPDGTRRTTFPCSEGLLPYKDGYRIG